MEQKYHPLPDLPYGRRWHVYENGSYLYLKLQIRRRFHWQTVITETTIASHGVRGLALMVTRAQAKVEKMEAEHALRQRIPYGKTYGKEETP